MICRRKGSKPDMYLEVRQDSDKDMFISIGEIGGDEHTIDFPNCINGGGRSPHTYEALLILLGGMQKDNIDDQRDEEIRHAREDI